MPGLRRSPQPYDHARLKAEIVARVGMGETVAAICAGGAGMPCEGSVQVWRRADAGFAAALAAARVRGGDRRRRMMFDAAVAEAFLARVRAGESVRRLLARPGMPSQAAYRHWRMTQAPFAEELWRLRGLRYERRSGALHGRYRGFDAAVAGYIVQEVAAGAVFRWLLSTDAALPCLTVTERWRRESPAWDAELRAAMKAGRAARRETLWAFCMVELTEVICDRIVSGASLRSVAADPKMPCARTLYAWAAKRPDFARDLARACELRDDFLTEEITELRLAAGPRGPAFPELMPLVRQRTRLLKRPGWKRARRGQG